MEEKFFDGRAIYSDPFFGRKGEIVSISNSPNIVDLLSFVIDFNRVISVSCVVVISLIVLLMCAFYTLFERQFLGHVQSRRGPKKVGPFGLMQPFVDGVKLFGKE